MIRFGITIASLAAAVSLALPANAATHQFTAILSGAAEVPPITTSGTGSATVTLNDETDMLSWNVTFSNLSSAANNAHFHGPATVLEGGAPVVINIALGAAAANSPLIGSAAITQPQQDLLMAGQLYINIHSMNNGGGEIRGQVVLQQTDGGTDAGDASSDASDASPDVTTDSAVDALVDRVGDSTTDGRTDGASGTAGMAGSAGRGGTAGMAGSAGSAGRGGAGAGGTGTAGTAGRGGSSGRGGSGAKPAPAEEDDGCGCRTVGGSGSAAGLIGLALAGLMLSRRMSQRRTRR